MYASVSGWLERLPRDRFPSLAELNALAPDPPRSGGGAPIAFAAPDPAREPYETTIFRTGSVPTRAENWHDVFNALVWLSFPLTKAVINARHYAELQAHDPSSGRRGTARDVLSLFDEGGVIAASSDASLLQLLRRFEWKRLFWERRPEVRQRMRFLVFGHAILEKALQPYKAVTAKALLLEVPESFISGSSTDQIAEADQRAARWFGSGELVSTRTLCPLPILGVPGWAKNESAAFYDDPQVFRPGYRDQGNAGTVGSSP